MRLIVVLAGLLLASCSGNVRPLVNVESAGLNAPRDVTLEQVERAIQLAAAHKNWSVRRIKPGHLEGSVQVRSHVATVDILHDTEQFSIRYKDSRYLKYDSGKNTIHRNYNNWVMLLKQAIIRCTSRIGTATSPKPVAPRRRWVCD